MFSVGTEDEYYGESTMPTEPSDYDLHVEERGATSPSRTDTDNAHKGLRTFLYCHIVKRRG